MELWKEIKGYEGLYKVSSFGRIKNISTGKILSPYISGGGYPVVKLYKNKTQYNNFTHRLIAIAFIPNPNNYPFINHKDENKVNYNIDNLEWCTCQYNLTYGTYQQRRIDKRIIPVVQKTKSGEIIKIHKSRIEAERETGIPHGNINMCISGKLKTAGGYIWENASEKVKE